MDSTANGFYQTAVEDRDDRSTTRTARVAIVTGLRKGQSYLYWRGDRLYQLPVSYWKGIGWINSPGYRDGSVNFDRPILPRCLECHATAMRPVSDTGVANRYRPASARLGISCETCHGSGRSHVLRERSPLRVVSTRIIPPGIVNPAHLSRARRLDNCALCHAGLGTLRSAAFSYVPGTRLEKHLDIPLPTLEDRIDVHGNQLELLERSACFLKSGMTCTTCHDPHQEQRDPVSLSGRCLTCHTPQSCGLHARRGDVIVGHCVDCHMPVLTSQTIVSNHDGGEEHPQVRSHWIRVYQESLERGVQR
ncbi:MAG TPA: multiheme c-type cytochrome [Gemmatimonadaceae bacterium]|nr:multiheme c-type cytochrome [Gemmatimonadaceae bacterium]